MPGTRWLAVLLLTAATNAVTRQGPVKPPVATAVPSRHAGYDAGQPRPAL
jgi:hypothetical protein